MTVRIKKGDQPDSIKKALSNFGRVKGFDAQKFCGILSVSIDPLVIQKELRDEWR